MESMYKGLGKEKIESLELAEESREKEWNYPSFVRELFHGKVDWSLIHPYPKQSNDDKKIGDDYLEKLRNFLTANLNPDDVDKNSSIPKEAIDGLANLGAFALKIPKEYDGIGLSQVNYNRMIHLVASYCGSTAVLLSAHQSIGVPQPLMMFGTKEQKKKYLPRFRQGAISGFALTEVNAGSDPRSMKTTATPVDNGENYLINGEKLWCSNGNIADILIVMCQTPPKIEHGKEKKQITAFIVETKTPGFEIIHRSSLMGLHGVELGVIKFNNLKVPKENILGNLGDGLKIAFVTLNTGRLTIPAASTGMSKLCLKISKIWAKERKQWGSAIGEHEAISSKLAEMAANTYAIDAVTWLTSHMADEKKLDIRLEAALAKLFSTEASWKIVDDALQIRGGRGYESSPSLFKRGETGYPIERAFRDSRINRIIEGTSQIMNLFIAREALDPHLKRTMSILGRGPILNKIKTLISAGWYYFFWLIKITLPSFVFRPGGNMPKTLSGHMLFVKRMSKRLAKSIFINMLLYQKKLESKQNILGRFVDIGCDLFVMSAVCSYASASRGKSDDGLADLFCKEARLRIKRRFEDLTNNEDKLKKKISKNILQDEYVWMENDIM